MFKITVKSSVNKDIKTINKEDLKRIFNNIHALELNPLPPGVKKIKKGPESYYRIRQGDFRIGYRFDTTQKLIEIIFVKRRNERTYNP
jgi:mRNA interferase RelE/StbE